ncbi:isopeptide-forming domain-containing fimbrial protein [Anaerococcus sp. Marseille-P3915]|uniref:isopeptide-forming domain-containing fimbrial protein n=1 Tax=Anaerococcus sp. Marseille-P3915 TaxID=2057799 RepID=UPI000D0B659C|nr:isopeptide-forming domain-containing fimbrial protein [Anaerococcus sp. Marseille-P3915]
MKKKILSLLTAFAMVFGIIAAPFTASAAEGTTLKQTTTSVTVHKILQSKENLDKKVGEEGNQKDVFPGLVGIDGTKYDGNQIKSIDNYFGQGSKDIGGVYFVWTNENDQVITANGEVVKKDNNIITVTNNKLPEKITKDDLKTALAGETVDNKGHEFDTSKLKTGKYKIYEIHSLSSYVNGENTLTKMKAVPVVINLPLNDIVKAHVYPKNTEDKPQIDKNFDSSNTLGTVEDKGKNQKTGAKYENYAAEKATAKAEIGKVIPYEVKTEIPADSKYEILKWTDSMTDGLTFDKDSLKITADNGITFEAKDYDVIADDHGFTLRFTQKGLNKVQNKDKAINITLKYSATVNADAVIDNPEKNDIKFDYGNKPGKEVKPTEVKPKDKEIKVKKTWAVDGNAVTEADKTVTAVFTLQVKDGENWKDVDSYTSTSAEEFTHTFTGLDDNKTYRVVERVSGYEPEYVTTTEAGKVEIRNNKDSENPKPLDPTEPKVVNGGRKFVKADQDNGARLEGAEFKIKNAEGQFLKAKSGANIQEAMTAYKAADKEYKDAVASLTQTNGVINYTEKITADKVKELREKRDKAFVAANIAYEWTPTEGDAAVFKSNEKGQLEVTGLEYAKNYEIVEIKAPAGYALPSNATQKFDVEKGSYTADATGVVYEGTDVVKTGEGADAKRINNKKVTIPQTGGIGSLVFIAAGLAIMGGAFIAYKRSQATA